MLMFFLTIFVTKNVVYVERNIFELGVLEFYLKTVNAFGLLLTRQVYILNRFKLLLHTITRIPRKYKIITTRLITRYRLHRYFIVTTGKRCRVFVIRVVV